jgi:SagB-type dehydrogenase family enzyme
MTSTASTYLDAVVHRSTRRMDPDGFRINWRDAPRKGKFFPGVEDLSLDRIVPPDDGDITAFGLGSLSQMLKDTYAEGNRRLAIHCNSDVDDLPRYGTSSHARGTASGGARYPVSIYLVAGPGSGLTPGVYYYNTYHHSLQRLLVGDQTGRVAAALGHDTVANQYLVLGIKYWQNSFKYHNFCFHAVSMDIGTVTHAWREWAAERGMRLVPHLWFDEADLAAMLSVEGDQEGIFAVVPLGAAISRPAPWSGDSQTFGRDIERSRTTRTFPMVVDMQAATAEGGRARPTAGALQQAAAPTQPAGDFFPLEKAEAPACGFREALVRRRSSFGRFVSQPMRQASLAALLEAGLSGGSYPCDASQAMPMSVMQLYVFVNHVEGIPPGSYLYDSRRRGLIRVDGRAPGEFLQKHYALENYNVEQAGAVIVPAVRGHAVIDAVGDRGYRLTSAAVGAATQAVYLAAATLAGVGCGAALGFDNAAYIDRLGLASNGVVPLIMIMVGAERAARANFRSEIL